ncbi:branched-chain amino acid ABC transporter permease [Pseudodesulfovibrio sp. JC047]|uniref:AzlC family ABC transporter permease n=1 Tax=Pseudodesulfovibrio sp. JC047 TaxID=2683199 RepID=UPI0013D0EE3D|nr:AzlC family ABC transporter permease [Pseudodesulfovibrio sp. JC047]NDV20769.1 branched-chain amino acid ABC transporter permease [Pseudodesulfovibrio sp. JC047]
MTDRKTAFLHGARDISPMLAGVMPFGLICGTVGVAKGMTEWGSSLMSVIIFAGASQLAAIQLMSEHATTAVVILTGLIINARFFMYSASIGPHFKGVPPLQKVGLAYLLTDGGYAVSIAHYLRSDHENMNKVWYYLGTNVTIWVGYVAATVVGAYLGAVIPTTWRLDFAIPLTFTAIVMPVIIDRPTIFAAIVSASVAVAAASLPYNLGLLVGAISGMIVGYLAERRLANA